MGNNNSSSRRRRETQRQSTGQPPQAGQPGQPQPPQQPGQQPQQQQPGRRGQPPGQPFYLQMGQPPVHYRYNPGGPMIFYVDRQAPSAPQPEVQETETIRNMANLVKSSLQLKHQSGQKYTVAFNADTLVPTTVKVWVAAMEKPDPSNHGAMFVPQNSNVSKNANCGTIAPSIGVSFETPRSVAFDFEPCQSFWKYNETQASCYPLVIVLSYELPLPEGQATEPEKEPKPRTQYQYTYAELTMGTDGLLTAKPLKQRLQTVDGSLFEIEEIYGMEQHVEGQVVDMGDLEGDTCVVCMASERDTIVMPCRHLCLCGECADLLRRQTNKCPICRTVIDRLVMKKHTKEAQ